MRKRAKIMSNAREQSRRWKVMSYEDQQKEQERPRRFTSSFAVVDCPDGVSMFRFPKDVPFITLDILPFLTDYTGDVELRSEALYFRHNNIGRPVPQNFICPKRTFGKPCPVCEEMNKYDFNDAEERDMRIALRPKERKLYLVRWLDGPEDTKDNLYILDQAVNHLSNLITQKLSIRDREDPFESSWAKFFSLSEGLMLKVGLTEDTFRNVSYIKPVSVDFKKRTYQYAKTEEEEEAFLKDMPDLYSCLVIHSYDDIKAAVQSGAVQTEPEMNTSPTKQERNKRLDPTQGYAPIVRGVSVFTTGEKTEKTVEDNLPF